MITNVPIFCNWTSPKWALRFVFEGEFLESAASTSPRDALKCDLLAGLMSIY